MYKKKDKILVLAPHTDDGELGCGGTISRFLEEKKEIFYVAFSTAKESVPKEMPDNILEVEVRKATKKLGIIPDNLFVYGFTVRKLNYVRQEILEELVKIRNEIRPDLVFMPSENDLHQDHHTVAVEAKRAFKNTSILAYELPWNNIEFKTECFVRLDQRHVDSKIKAIQKYESQKDRIYMNRDYLRSHLRMRGVQIGVEYAECFEVIRWVL